MERLLLPTEKQPRHDVMLLLCLWLNLLFGWSICVAAESEISVQGSKQVVQWLHFDFAPYYIDESGAGRDESVIKLLQPLLSQYQFSMLHVPASRLMHALNSSDEPVCVLSLYKTVARQQVFNFSSHPSTFGLPIELITRDGQQDALRYALVDGRYSLAKIIGSSKNRFGVMAARSFGAGIDQVLTDMPHFNLAGESALSSLLGMVSKDRIDYTLGYPDEMYYLASAQNLDGLISLPLHETADFSLGYVGCNKSKITAQLVADIDSALLQLYQGNDFLELMLRWLPLDAQKRVYRHYQRYLLNLSASGEKSQP